MDAATRAYLLVRGGSCTGSLSSGLTARLADLARKMPGEVDDLLDIVSAAMGEGSAEGYEDGRKAGYDDGYDDGREEGRQEAEAALKAATPAREETGDGEDTGK